MWPRSRARWGQAAVTAVRAAAWPAVRLPGRVMSQRAMVRAEGGGGAGGDDEVAAGGDGGRTGGQAGPGPLLGVQDRLAEPAPLLDEVELEGVEAARGRRCSPGLAAGVLADGRCGTGPGCGRRRTGVWPASRSWRTSACRRRAFARPVRRHRVRGPGSAARVPAARVPAARVLACGRAAGEAGADMRGGGLAGLVAEVAPQVPAVGDLDRAGGARRGRPRRRRRPGPGRSPRPRDEPRSQSRKVAASAVREQVHDPAGLHVDQHGAVDVPLAQREVVHARAPAARCPAPARARP